MKKYVLLAAWLSAITAAMGLVYSTLIATPKFTSRVSMIVLGQSSLSQVMDYTSIASSQSVLEAIGAKDSVKLSYDELKNMVEVKNDSGTNIIKATATTNNKELSYAIVSALPDELNIQGERLFGNANVGIVDKPFTLENADVMSIPKATVLGALTGLAVAGMITFVAYDPTARRKNKPAVSRIKKVPARPGKTKEADSSKSEPVTTAKLAAAEPISLSQPVEIADIPMAKLPKDAAPTSVTSEADLLPELRTEPTNRIAPIERETRRYLYSGPRFNPDRNGLMPINSSSYSAGSDHGRRYL